MTLFAKALIEAFYGAPAHPSYFAGCSTGGQQALMEAQRFPTDYDGILAGDAALNRTHLHTITVWTYGATHRTPASYIPATKFDVINQRVLAQCGGQDGGAPGDPFLTDPRNCKFDPGTLECPAGTDGPTCLNPDQVTAMRQYYGSVVNASNGAVINPGYMPGIETSNPGALGLALNESLTEPAFDSLFKWVFGLTWQWQTFDFNHDMDTVDQVLTADLNADSVDLSAFAGRGGKRILYHGWADPLLPSPSLHQLLQCPRRRRHLRRHGPAAGARQDPAVRPAVHGAGDVALLRTAPAPTRSADRSSSRRRASIPSATC